MQGIVSELSNFFKLITMGSRRLGSTGRNALRTNPRSIKQMASKSVLSFPLIVSTVLEEDTLLTLMKSLEAEYADYVQVVLSQDNLVDLASNRNKEDLIKSLGVNSGDVVDQTPGPVRPIFEEIDKYQK